MSSVSDSPGERGIGKDTNASLKDRNLLTNSVGQLNANYVIDGSVAVVEWLSIDVYQPLSDALKIMSTTALSFCSPHQGSHGRVMAARQKEGRKVYREHHFTTKLST